MLLTLPNRVAYFPVKNSDLVAKEDGDTQQLLSMTPLNASASMFGVGI